MKLKGIIKIKGKIRAVSGISIGGSSSALELNVYENDIIKTSQAVPYISGSSLKGKMRDILAKIVGSLDETEDLTLNHNISELFGSPENIKEHGNILETQLQIQDAFAETVIEKRGNETIKRFAGSVFENIKTEYPFIEMKTENTTDRYTKKSMPRKLVRTLPEEIFPFEMKYKIFNETKKTEHLKHIKAALKMLEDEFIGGNGSRGYGQIKFENVKATEYLIENYELVENKNFKYTDILNPKID